MPRLHIRPDRWAVLAVLGLVAAGCAGDERAAPPTTTSTVPSTSTTTTTVEPTTTTTTEAPTTTTTAAPPTTTGAPATVVSRGNPGRRMVALTFDAGADAGFTARILDVLDRTGVHATFGVTGRWAEQHPDLVRRIAAAGHLLMNHTYEHRSFTGVSARPPIVDPSERRRDVERTDEIIRALTGSTTRPWFRPPYGDYDASVNAVVGSLGYRYNVLWTVDSLGWRGGSAASITSRCLQGAVPGAIFLFHVGSQSQDAAALPDIIAGLRSSGYRLGTLADVVGA